jgi:transposase
MADSLAVGPSVVRRQAAEFSRELCKDGIFQKILSRPLVVVMEARRAADALKGRPVKTDRADARALAEMLQTGWGRVSELVEI